MPVETMMRGVGIGTRKNERKNEEKKTKRIARGERKSTRSEDMIAITAGKIVTATTMRVSVVARTQAVIVVVDVTIQMTNTVGTKTAEGDLTITDVGAALVDLAASTDRDGAHLETSIRGNQTNLVESGNLTQIQIDSEDGITIGRDTTAMFTNVIVNGDTGVMMTMTGTLSIETIEGIGTTVIEGATTNEKIGTLIGAVPVTKGNTIGTMTTANHPPDWKNRMPEIIQGSS